jgi:CubicO group peptidase (beta-lactamase class C family)
MWRSGLVVTVAAVLTSAMLGPASADEGVDTAAVDRFVADFADNAAYPGVAIAITKGDRVVHVSGYGHGPADSAVTATTPMPIASVSKSFTSLAVMQLVEAGKLELDKPLRRYVRDFRIADDRGATITVRQLLNQTSGITDSTLPEKSLNQPHTLAGAVDRARQATLAAGPGTRYSYSNTNYHLAARLVEVVADEPFADYLRRHVFEPAGMSATTTIDLAPRDVPDTVAKGYAYAYGASVPVEEPERFVAGSDGVISTARDMARWLVVQSNGGVTTDGTRLVSAESITAMHSTSDSRSSYALGWETEPDGRVRHSGIWFTHTAGELLTPSGYGIAVMTNSGVALGNEGTAGLEDGLATLLEGGDPEVGGPMRLIIDLALATLTLLSLALGIRSLRGARRWARRHGARPVWQLVPRLLPRFVPLVILVTLPDLVTSFIAGGRDLTYLQFTYYSAALVVWVLMSSLCNLGVLATRVLAITTLRRSPAPSSLPPSPPSSLVEAR